MKTLHRLVAPTTALLLLASLLTAQVRTKKVPVEKQSFPDKVAAAKAAFDAGQFAKSMRLLGEATRIARAALEKTVLAAMPAAPENFVKEKPKKRMAQNNPLVPLVTMGAIPFEQKYRATKGRGSIQVQVHVASAMAKIFGASFQMAAFNDKLEVIKYNAHKGLLETRSKDRMNLKILITSPADAKIQHFVDINTNGGIDDEQLFKMFDQKWVDGLAKLLG